VDQAARFGISLEGASLYCTLEPCNWCFKQLIQAGIREIFFEEPYESKNKEFDLYWRGIMESNDSITEFRQVRISDEAVEMVIRILQGSSARGMPATSPEEPDQLDPETLKLLLEQTRS